MSDLIERLRDMEESWADAIKRMDSNYDNGIMTSIRYEQHDTLKKAADEIESLRAKVAELEEDKVFLNKRIDELEATNRLMLTTIANYEAKHEAVEPCEYCGDPICKGECQYPQEEAV